MQLKFKPPIADSSIVQYTLIIVGLCIGVYPAFLSMNDSIVPTIGICLLHYLRICRGAQGYAGVP